MPATPVPAGPGQNLISPNKQADFGKPPGYFKSIGLDFLSVATAAALGYSYFRYLTQGLSPWWIFGAFLAFSACSALQAFLAQGRGRRTLIVLAETIAFMACFFFYTDWQTVLVAGTAGFVVLLWGYFMGRWEVHNELEVQFFKATRSVLGKVVTAVILIMIIVYVPQAQGNGVFLSQDNFKTLFDWSAGLLDNFYPSIPFTGSFGDFTKSFAQAELANDPSFGTLSAPQRSAAVDQTAAQLSDAVTKTTGIAPTPDEPVSTVARDYIVSALDGTRSKFPSQFALLWIVVLFIILRSIGIVFVWIAQLAALVVYEVLIAIGFIRIDEIAETREAVVY